MSLIFVLFMMILLRPLEAQWERVPLNGGHVDKFVRSPFDSSLVLTKTRWGGVFYTDGSYTNWKPLFLVGPDRPFQDIKDLAITKSGAIILIADNKCWRSYDWGVSWSEMKIPGASRNPWAIQVTKSDVIVVFYIDLQIICSSTDEGISWTTIGFPKGLNATIYGFYTESESGDIILLCGFDGSFARSTDRGITWTVSTQFGGVSTFITPCQYTEGQTMKFGMIANDTCGLHYFVSNDSGRTWVRVDRSMPAVSNSYDYAKSTLISLGENVLLASGEKYYSSSNRGVDWEINPNLEACSIIVARDTILGSFIMDGIRLSADGGKTWSQPETGPQITTFSSMQYKAADRDIGYAIVQDREGTSPTRYALRQTSDRGRTWKTLFSSPWLDNLIVRSQPETRYYALSRNHEIITGVIDQTVPDTLLSWEENSNWTAFVSTDAFPDYMYISAMILPYLGRFYATFNGGSTWQSYGLPPNWFNCFGLYPSIVHPDLVAGVGFPMTGSQDLLCGLYMNPGLQGWRLQDYMIVEPLAFVENDLLFKKENIAFSSDYGNNWYTNKTGIDTLIHLQYAPFFVSRDRLFICTNWNGLRIWYYFRNGVWHPVRDGTGTPVQSRRPDMLEMMEDDLYASYQYMGLYRLSKGLATGVEHETHSHPIRLDLACHPNPFSSSTEITFAVPIASRTNVSVFDIYGRRIAQLVDEEKREGTHSVRFDASQSPSGVYFYRLTAANTSITRKMCLVK